MAEDLNGRDEALKQKRQEVRQALIAEGGFKDFMLLTAADYRPSDIKPALP